MHNFSWRWPFADMFPCTIERERGQARCRKAGGKRLMWFNFVFFCILFTINIFQLFLGSTFYHLPVESLLPLRPTFMHGKLAWAPRLASEQLTNVYGKTWRQSCHASFYDHTYEKARNKTCFDTGCTKMSCADLSPFAQFAETLDVEDGLESERLVFGFLFFFFCEETFPLPACTFSRLTKHCLLFQFHKAFQWNLCVHVCAIMMSKLCALVARPHTLLVDSNFLFSMDTHYVKLFQL